MSKQIYRKSLLEKMSSPDQLDKMIVITSPSFWLALIGGAAIVVVALVWSIFGKLPIKTEATGLFVPDQGTFNLAANTSGIVSSLQVKIGDYVKKGDVIMTLSDEDVQQELGAILERRERVSDVTLDSRNDIVTADNRDLIDLKTQIAAAGLERDQQAAMLASYQSELSILAPKVNAAQVAMEQAQQAYYNAIDSGSVNTAIQLQYNEAQSVYSQVSSQYAQANASAESARVTYNNALDSVLNSLQETIQQRINESSSGEEKAALEALKSKAISAVGTGVAPDSLDSDIKSAIAGTGLSNLEQLWVQYKTAKDILVTVEADYSEALANYESAAAAYENASNTATHGNVNKEQLMAVFNQKSTEYQTLYSQKSSLESNILSLQSQIQAANVGQRVHVDSYRQQFNSMRSAIIDGLNAEIEKYEYALKKTQVTATVSGMVSDIKVGVGSAVGQGNEIVTIRQLSEENLIVCYIPINTGKKIEPGMEVVVCPSTVNESEYGHMQAEVISVDDYVSTAASIRSMLGDDTLVQAFTQNGPVVGVICRLRVDETTASGYWWSNKKGAELMVPEGTLVTADIITDEKAPITMLIPYLKDKLSMSVEPGAGDKEGQ
ncbi:MAG: NHLP bacteriocin system secretion protein [Clostridia bacterium]|nr:NHLP bacteriocin system secretion protein [Clostridia bacterium]